MGAYLSAAPSTVVNEETKADHAPAGASSAPASPSAPTVGERGLKHDLDAASLITKTDYHLILLGIAVLLALTGARFDLLMHIFLSACLIQAGFMLLQERPSMRGAHFTLRLTHPTRAAHHPSPTSTHVDLSALQVPAKSLEALGLDPTLLRYITSLGCWIAAGCDPKTNLATS